MAKKNEKSAIATVLAFEKKLVVSDANMYSTVWDKKYEVCKPVAVVEKSVRGTISNRLKDTVKNDPMKMNKEVEKANLQTVDSAALPINCDTLKINFTVKVLSGAEIPSVCNNPEHNRQIIEMGKRYNEKYGYEELAKRYVINIVNGRFLWRNRVGAEKIEIKVWADGKEFIFDAYEFSLNKFDTDMKDVNVLSNMVADSLSGKRSHIILKVEAYALLGEGQEVYPSEELVLDKGNSKKSKILYQLNGVGAMHSQKVANAIRTIDTWYPSFEENGNRPIAIEPYGAVTTLGKAFRISKDKADFYTLFDKYSLGDDFDSPEDAHYVMAMLVRGGVFGQSSKE